MPEQKSLTSNDPKLRSEIEGWVEKTAMKINISECLSRGGEYLEAQLKQNAGNVLPCMTMPWFAAHFILNVSWMTILKSLPIVIFSEEKQYFILSLMYKLKGIEMLKNTKPIYTLAKAARLVNVNFLNLGQLTSNINLSH